MEHRIDNLLTIGILVEKPIVSFEMKTTQREYKYDSKGNEYDINYTYSPYDQELLKTKKKKTTKKVEVVEKPIETINRLNLGKKEYNCYGSENEFFSTWGNLLSLNTYLIVDASGKYDIESKILTELTDSDTIPKLIEEFEKEHKKLINELKKRNEKVSVEFISFLHEKH